MKEEGELVNIKFNTTQEHLMSIGLTIEGLKEEIKWIMEATGQVLRTLLQLSQREKVLTLDAQKINQVIRFNKTFKAVHSFKGFNRHLLEYTKNNIEDIFFNARVASWLSQQGYEIEFEPSNPDKLKHPDLLIKKADLKIAIECKNPNIKDFYQRSTKRKIADFVFKKIDTLSQFNFYFLEEPNQSEFEALFTDDFVDYLLELGNKGQETRFQHSKNLEISVIPKRDYINIEEYQLVSEMSGISVNVNSGLRLPAFTFMENARSIQVHGPVRNFNNRWNNFRKKSKEQGIDGLPLIVVVNGDHVLGDPESHLEYFRNVWLTDKNKSVSGLGLITFATLDGSTSLEYHSNSESDIPINFFP